MEDFWFPAASLKGLAVRAETLRRIRDFFAQRHVMEVETPLLSRAALPDEFIQPVTCGSLFLSTSPEAPMKRLLAAGSGPIYQITRAFRKDECGPWHNPEFTMLEWYRPGFSWRDLIDETIALVQSVLGGGPVREFTFEQAVRQWAGVCCFTASLEELVDCLPCQVPLDLDREGVLDLVLSQRVEPAFKAMGGLVVLTHFPEARAALARLDPGPPPVALRFELYAQGVELVNGYQELTDAKEQEARLLKTNQRLQAAGQTALPLDQHFLAALRAGLPECAGAALGVDRLAMLAFGGQELSSVMAFPFDRA
ncbi:MAG: EF-P lysine aminoacylase EpmA [Magnetococcus sp. YQC-5]